MLLHVLYEDNHLLAVAKPAGLATMGVAPGEPSLLQRTRDYIREKYHKPGNVYLGVVSRLDSLATGVVLFARTSKAAARLTAMFRDGEIRKQYLAVVEQRPMPAAGQCSDWIGKDEAAHRMYVCQAGTAGAKEARLAYRTLQQLTRGALLQVDLQTGRKHQIRVQLGHRGWPVLGDRKYGARASWEGIALHAHSLQLLHPVRKTPLTLAAPLPRSWRALGITVRIDDRDNTP